MREQDENKPVVNPVIYPTLVFREEIVFDVEPDSIDNLESFLKEIIDVNKSEYDELLVLEYSRQAIGEYEGTIRVSLNEIRQEKSFKYTVKDTVRPIIHQEYDLITDEGEPLDIEDYLRISDNSLREGETLEIEVTGDINWDIPGVYPITISVEDEAGNIASMRTQVVVNSTYEPEPEIEKEPYIPPQPTVPEVKPTPTVPTPSPKPEPEPEPEPTPDPETEPEPEPDPSNNENGTNE